MYFVVLLHILGHGEILNNADGTTFSAAWLIEIVAYCAVDCYAVISGFVAYREQERPYNFKKYSSLWLGVFFWSFLLYIFGVACGIADFSLENALKFATPVLSKVYWYFTAYTALYFIAPFLLKLTRALNKRQSALLLLTLFVLFVICEFRTQPFKMQGGYSFAWLAVLYVVGALIKKCNMTAKIKKRYCAAVIVISTAVTFLCKISGGELQNIFISYTSPTVLLNALAFFAMFCNMRFGKRGEKAISLFAPAAFGVYLIHEHSVIRGVLFSLFTPVADFPVHTAVPAVLAIGVVIFVICVGLELLRIKLFKILKINQAVEKLLVKIGKPLTAMFNKFSNLITEDA